MYMEKILEIQNLEKSYKNVHAVRGVSFSVSAGEIVGLLGPNGAGKTTVIDMVLGLVEPSGGSIRIFEKDFKTHRQEILRKVNFAAVYAELPGNLTVWQNLYISGLLYKVPALKKRVEEMLRDFNLERFAKRKTGVLSSGEKSRLHLAKALLNEPRLLLVDEATASLDPSATKMMHEKIRNYVRDLQAAVLWTSHDMYEVEEICDRVLFISHGKILLEGDPRTLPSQFGKKNLEDLFITVAREPLSLEYA